MANLIRENQFLIRPIRGQSIHPSPHPANKALQILCLQTRRAHRVIGRRAALFEDLQIAAGTLGDAGEHVEEVFALDVARATACHHDSTRLE